LIVTEMLAADGEIVSLCRTEAGALAFVHRIVNVALVVLAALVA
jgi:hypothetical protein